MAFGFIDLCRFFPVSIGIADWVYSSNVPGCQSPTLANAVNGTTYFYYAVTLDQTQWELGQTIYNSGTLTFPRTTVLANSSGTGTSTGQSGAGSKINFATVPQVSIVLTAENFLTISSWQYIETLTANNSASLTTSVFTSAFDDYALVFSNIVPITDSVNFNATVESGGTFQATNYLNFAGGLTTSIDLETAATLSNLAGKGLSGTLFLNAVNSTTVNKYLSGRVIQTQSGGATVLSINVAGYWNGGQGVVTRLRFQMSSGNISTGLIKVYGIRNS